MGNIGIARAQLSTGGGAGGGGGGGGSVSVETPSGLVNGVNTVYVATNLPLYVIQDNQALVQNFGYTLSGSGPYTITTDVAPFNFIRSVYGSGFTISTPTGSVNGSNVTFVAAAIPLYVISDNQTYFENNGYTRSGLTITMDAAPFNFIRVIS